ncbi:MAG TPA: nodulation protein NfeD [Candidatus Dormibacteraeota bacterium]|nr:nodulation protein NfeD [Candidatus Dormibacteraeota bacterium]
MASTSSGRTSANPSVSRIVEIHIDGEIEPVLASYVNGGIDEANQTKASLVLITMDTPGGLTSSMREIIQHILSSRVPVAVYISPAGSRGASAGFYILLSADVAAMAPATHCGAASPLLVLGGYPVQLDETLRRKINNDATAYLRSYTVKRGRNASLAETAVTDSKAFTEKEALDGKLIDVVADSTDDLLTKLNGRTITRFDGSSVRLELSSPLRVAYEMSTRQKFLARIVQPDVFFILLIVGVLGLYTEFTHPGMIAPGVVGGICMVLALYAMNILPVNFTGLLLIALALALFILEAKFTSHGVLGIGGVVAMFLGALMLIRSPLTNAGVSVGVALGVTAPFALITIFLMRLVLRSRGWKQSTGVEQLIGAEGLVTEAFVPAAPGQSGRGMVRVHGELWRATAEDEVPQDAAVRVVSVDGLTLHVKPTNTPRGLAS